VAVVLAAAQLVFAAPPAPSFTQLPASLQIGETVDVTANPNDPDGDVDAATGIAWDFDYDGDPANFEVNATGPNATISYSTPGDKTVGLRVTDGDIADGTADTVYVTQTVSVNNALPAASFTAAPGTAQIGQTVNFNGVGSSDPDGGTITRYEWDLDGDASTGPQGFETDTGGTATTSSQYTTPGSVTVRLRVTDDEGEPSSTPATQTVTVNNALPTASFTATPNPAQTNHPITFDGAGSNDSGDPGGAITAHEWDFDYDGTTFNVDATGASVQHSYPDPGPRIVALRVRDNNQATGTVSMRVTVTTTPPPNILPQASFRISPASPFTGDTVTLSSTSSDPDGPLVSQDWDTDNDGQFDDASGPVASRSFPSAGGQTVRLRVVDAHGASAIAVGRVDVRARLIPPPPPPPPPPPLTVLDSNVTISGRFSNSSTTIGRLIVKAPAGAQIAPACKGRGCPKRVKKLRAKAAAKRVRVRAFERRWRPGAKITIRVTKPGFIGTHTQFKIRRGKRPKRIELCVQPAAKRASACPQS
jgi:PKD repeat protein